MPAPTLPPSPLPDDVTPEDALDLYRRMLVIRRFEEKAGQLYGMGLIGGHCHLYIGQEAIVVGLQALLKPGDQTIAGYRDHAHALAAGSPPEAVMAELLGRTTGLCGGRGGSMHLSDPARGFFGGHALVGSQVPIGAGLAFAARYRRSDAVAVIFYGDGAAERGQIEASYGLALRYGLPAIFAIEMNDDTPPAPKRTLDPPEVTLADRAKARGLPAERVDGMDVFAVRAAGQRAVRRARAGKGATVLELRTDRYRGHATAHVALTPEEDRARKARDCLARLRARLADHGRVDEAALREAEHAARETVAQAAAAARDAPHARTPEPIHAG